MKLKSMSIGRLVTLRDQVDVAIKSRVTQDRHDLEARLANLSRFGSSGARGISFGMRRGAVAPKYRNPENPNETWAGRGLKPRWLAAALKAGHKIDEFLIGGAPKAATAEAQKGQRRRKAAPKKSLMPRKAGARKAKAAPRLATPRKARASKPTAQPEASA